MKKKLLLFVVFTVLLTGCSLIVDKGQNDPVRYVTANDVTARMDNGETFAFVIGDKKCPACVQYMSTLQEFLDNDGKALDYIDIDKLNEKQIGNLAELVKVRLNENFEATPTTYFVVNGELKNFEVGVMDYNRLATFYNNLIGVTE